MLPLKYRNNRLLTSRVGTLEDGYEGAKYHIYGMVLGYMTSRTMRENMPKQKLFILLLEDNAVIAQRFFDIFTAWPLAGAVRSCDTLEQALRCIAEEKVDLLVADLNLPDGSGVDAIRMLSQVRPEAQAIVISALGHRSLVIDAIQAGALGYLLKDDESLEVIQACERMLSGESPMSASIARLMIEAVRGSSAPVAPAPPSNNNPLTPREMDVLNAIARGKTYQQLADQLGISLNTVPVHIRNIYRKLQVRNRSEATYEARLLGILG